MKKTKHIPFRWSKTGRNVQNLFENVLELGRLEGDCNRFTAFAMVSLFRVACPWTSLGRTSNYVHTSGTLVILSKWSISRLLWVANTDWQLMWPQVEETSNDFWRTCNATMLCYRGAVWTPIMRPNCLKFSKPADSLPRLASLSQYLCRRRQFRWQCCRRPRSSQEGLLRLLVQLVSHQGHI